MDDRVLAGVCGGLGEKLSIDPVILRATFVVLSAVWGLGLVLYGFVWFVVPVVDSPTTNPVPISPRGGVLNAVGLLFVAVAGLLTLGTLDLLPRGRMLYPFVLLAVGVVLLWGRRPLRPVPRPALGPGPNGDAVRVAPSRAGSDPRYEGPGQKVGSTSVEDPAEGEDPSVDDVDHQAWARFVAAHPPPDSLDRGPGTRTKPPRTPRPIPLGTLTAGFLLVTAGLAYLARGADLLDTSWVTLGGVALVVVGAVLVVGGWLGRPGGLTGLGLGLIAFLLVATVVRVPLTGGLGRRDLRPVDLASVGQGYDLMGGTMVLDLGALTFDERAVEVRVGVAFGQLTVLVPEGVEVSVEARTGLGRIDVFGDSGSGLAVARETTSAGFGVGVPRFVIVADVGVGTLTVERVP